MYIEYYTKLGVSKPLHEVMTFACWALMTGLSTRTLPLEELGFQT
jgi:hypothetical protein